jgi:hypothetical protein
MKTFRTQQGKLVVVLELEDEYQQLVDQDPGSSVLLCATMIHLPESHRVVTSVTGLTKATVDQWNILVRAMNAITVEMVTTDLVRAQMSAGIKPS